MEGVGRDYFLRPIGSAYGDNTTAFFSLISLKVYYRDTRAVLYL